jgi:alkanesulfonate monooxygenase SsuD/methylene tetrahydromethanopterin reductase-like flavin-dependent oxidoreductase (luciferase family)
VQPELPMWIGGSSEAAIQRTARVGTGWQAGPETPEEAGRVVAAIKAAAKAHGRTIDEDHYGSGFPFYFGSPDDPVLSRPMEAYQKRTKRDPLTYFAVGDKDVIVKRIADYVANGVEKFVLRPVGRGDEAILTQTQRLIDEVLPEMARRWPKRKKAAAE